MKNETAVYIETLIDKSESNQFIDIGAEHFNYLGDKI